MKPKNRGCVELEPELIATAAGEANASAAGRVRGHLETCGDCRAVFEGYRAIEAEVGGMRARLPAEAEVGRARERLESRLVDLRSRLVAYRVFPSPFGNILLARTERGVMLVEYLGRGKSLERSRLARLAGMEAVEDGSEIEGFFHELRRYLEGRLERLAWPLDLRLARGEFHRKVLEETSGIPYGAVLSYAGLAKRVGRPRAARAAAQALRWNPLPIVIPCHRVVGVTGALVGYSGGEPSMKKRLLALEGVPTGGPRGKLRIERDSMYVRAPGDEEYCLPTCPSTDPTGPPVHTARAFPIGGVLFGSRERAESVGLVPCRHCRPDLHPLSA